MRNKNIKDMESIIEILKENLRINEKQKLFEALKDWNAVVGDKIAAKTEPMYIREGILFIKTSGAVWQQEINFRKKEIIDVINTRIGRPVVKDIKFR